MPSCDGMPTIVTVSGVLLIAAALVDVFQTLFHPAGRGGMSDWTARIVWKLFRKIAARYSGVLIYAGPASILAIIVSWVGLTWFGFGLVYLPHVQSGFTYQVPGDAHHSGILT